MKIYLKLLGLVMLTTLCTAPIMAKKNQSKKTAKTEQLADDYDTDADDTDNDDETGLDATDVVVLTSVVTAATAVTAYFVAKQYYNVDLIQKVKGFFTEIVKIDQPNPAKADTVKTEQAKPVEQPKTPEVNQPKAEQPKAEQAKPVQQQAPVKTPEVNQPKVEPAKPVQQQAPVKTPEINQPKAEQPKVEQAKPVVSTPINTKPITTIGNTPELKSGLIAKTGFDAKQFASKALIYTTISNLIAAAIEATGFHTKVGIDNKMYVHGAAITLGLIAAGIEQLPD